MTDEQKLDLEIEIEKLLAIAKNYVNEDLIDNFEEFARKIIERENSILHVKKTIYGMKMLCEGSSPHSLKPMFAENLILFDAALAFKKPQQTQKDKRRIFDDCSKSITDN